MFKQGLYIESANDCNDEFMQMIDEILKRRTSEVAGQSRYVKQNVAGRNLIILKTITNLKTSRPQIIPASTKFMQTRFKYN